MIVDSAVYREGKRVAEPATVADLAAAARQGGCLAWLGLHEPSTEELLSLIHI